MSVLLVAGVLDSLMFPLPIEIFDLCLKVPAASPEFWGRANLPFLTDLTQIYRLLVAAAFGQLAHYYVWLFVMPGLSSKTGVKTRLQILSKKLFLLAGALIIALAVFHTAFARTVYLAIAAAHGFVELGTLPLLFSRREAGYEPEHGTSLNPSSQTARLAQCI